MSEIFVKAPSGIAALGQAISRSMSLFSSAPNGSRCPATTIVFVAIGFFCASRLFKRSSA